ncbi:hypothetical protein [Streptomyces sp. NPDC051909]|uniref:hypothetical protein n=1 Tax=Streptomyces sp. NPDC051909 TaxID=3154944 RepID=UPI0034471FEA
MSIRTRALTTLTVTVALALSGCGTKTTPAARSADDNAPVVQATVAPSADSPSGDPAVASTPTPKAPAPRHTPGPGSLPVTVVPRGKPAKLALVTPPAKSGRPAGADTPGLELASYDQRTGEAVLAPADGAPRNARTAADAEVRPGRLIDSPPTPAAPRGALVAITRVKQTEAGKTTVDTRPATVSELLGDSSASLRTALDPRDITVEPQVKDLKVSFTQRADGGNGSVSAGLKLDADTTIPLPHGASVALAGSVQLDPSLDFSYEGRALSPRQAGVGFEIDARADWRVRAGISGSAEPMRIPLAKLHATPTVMAGPVPIVITLDLTVYATLGADGQVTIEAEQELAGHWGIRSDYTKGGGWKTATDPGTLNISPVRATLDGRASVRTGLTVEGSVALYDAVGLKASIKPYLRTAVEGSVTIDSTGAAPVVNGKAGVYGGLDIDGALTARIAIFGTPLFEKELPIPVYRREWPLAAYGTPAPATASPEPTRR